VIPLFLKRKKFPPFLSQSHVMQTIDFLYIPRNDEASMDAEQVRHCHQNAIVGTWFCFTGCLYPVAIVPVASTSHNCHSDYDEITTTLPMIRGRIFIAFPLSGWNNYYEVAAVSTFCIPICISEVWMGVVFECCLMLLGGGLAGKIFCTPCSVCQINAQTPG